MSRCADLLVAVLRLPQQLLVRHVVTEHRHRRRGQDQLAAPAHGDLRGLGLTAGAFEELETVGAHDLLLVQLV